jgi:hypothetical protein
MPVTAVAMPARHPVPGRIVDLGDVRLWVDDQGEGDPLLLALRLEEDHSLALMREHVANLQVAVITDAHPAYVIAHKPEECAALVRAFLDAGEGRDA